MNTDQRDIFDIELMYFEALRVLAEFINRSTGQHLRRFNEKCAAYAGEVK